MEYSKGDSDKETLLTHAHNSLVNGQRTQMVGIIKEYGVYEFFEDYRNYLLMEFETIELEYLLFKYFTDATISFIQITNREGG